MLYYYGIDVSEGIDVNKTSKSKECDVCHYWCFLNYSFKFQQNVCNKCHDLLMTPAKLSDIAIWNIKGSDYCCIISLIIKNESVDLLKNADLTEKSGTLKVIKLKIIIIIFKIIYKMEKIITNFDGIKIPKQKFHQHQKPIPIENVDTNKIVVSNRVYFGKKGFKYFVGYEDAKK